MKVKSTSTLIREFVARCRKWVAERNGKIEDPEIRRAMKLANDSVAALYVHICKCRKCSFKSFYGDPNSPDSPMPCFKPRVRCSEGAKLWTDNKGKMKRAFAATRRKTRARKLARV